MMPLAIRRYTRDMVAADSSGLRTYDARFLSGCANPFAFTGQRYDAATGTYHFLYRTYLPWLGRWGQRDPLGYVDGVSLYEYVRGCPAILVDPLGLIDRNRLFLQCTGGVNSHWEQHRREIDNVCFYGGLCAGGVGFGALGLLGAGATGPILWGSTAAGAANSPAAQRVLEAGEFITGFYNKSTGYVPFVRRLVCRVDLFAEFQKLGKIPMNANLADWPGFTLVGQGRDLPPVLVPSGSCPGIPRDPAFCARMAELVGVKH